MSPSSRVEDPIGTVTRGTTNPNRLRRVDRWIAGTQAHRLRSCPHPVVVDLGYGATPVTALELHDRLRAVAPGVTVVGLEISRERVAAALPLARPGVGFAVGGFEVPLAGGARASIIRAFNVLRQYDEEAVDEAWTRMRSRLTPDGLLVEGTCDELGRRSAWVALDRSGPLSLTLSWRLRGLDRPSGIAERLPKALIHRNVPGEPVHDLLRRIDDAWDRSAGHASWGARQRFIATAETLRDGGIPLFGGRSRWRLGELTVAWDAVAPT